MTKELDTSDQIITNGLKAARQRLDDVTKTVETVPDTAETLAEFEALIQVYVKGRTPHCS